VNSRPAYFPVLDLLRFLASLCVLLAHSSVFYKESWGNPGLGRFIQDAGYYGVIFFYVLSGFLITYLLLIEKEKTGSIGVRNFYIRRALRIWPLYYLIVLLSFFIFPALRGEGLNFAVRWKVQLVLYLCFLPNVAVLGGFYLDTLFPTYTIGYEEQFYLVWPWILSRCGKRLISLLAGLLILPLLLQFIHLAIVTHEIPLRGAAAKAVRRVLTFVEYSNMSAFIAGAMAAVVYLKGSERMSRITGRAIWVWVLGLAIAALMLFKYPAGWGYCQLLSLLYALLILCLVHRPGVKGVWALLVRGGKWSYGIYIYHPVLFILVAWMIDRWHWSFDGHPLLTYLLFLTVTFVCTLAVASLSYRFFEKRFLLWKGRFRTGGV
jgi:peptidoglycan/LPS O-acetylase OafA/YrhL